MPGMLSMLLGVAAAASGAGGERLAIEDVSPGSPRAGQELTIRVAAAADAAVQVCLVPGAGDPRCADGAPGTRRLTLSGPYPGRWTVVARAGGRTASRDLVIRPRGRRLVILTAGDSMVRPVVKGIKARLRRRPDVVVLKDIHNGSGLTKPPPDWIPHAREVVERMRPDVVLMFMGGGDGYPIDGVHCCEPPWIERYSERQRTLMRTFAQGGRARVYWSSLPSPAPWRDTLRWVWNTLNRALALSVADDDARILDTNALVSPGFEWRRTMRWRGQRLVVRRRDGFHLTSDGGAIVARAFLRQLRTEGVDVPTRRRRQ